MRNESLKIALAYVGVIVGAGLSSGQDIMQYFLSFGIAGIVGAAVLGVLNMLFGRITLALGSYYQANSHQEVLGEITTPILNRVIDGTLVISNFVIGFVMIAGAGANLEQQFGVPAWAGSLLCAALIVVVSFLNFEKITGVLGVFTPVIVVITVLVAIYTFAGKSYDVSALDAVARTITPALPNIGLSVVNYFSLCILTGVSMAFVLGGSVVRIGVAEKAGAIGGMLVGGVILCAAGSLFANVDAVKDAEVPMLKIVEGISPVLAVVYAAVIFALIFNTAFSLFYATARRFSRGSDRKMHLIMIATVAAGYLCSFGGFKELVAKMYPVLGYLGIVLLVVLLVAWLKNRGGISDEKMLRRKMIRLHLKKHDRTMPYTSKDQAAFERLGERSVADTETVKQGVQEFAHELIESDVDEWEFAEKKLKLDGDGAPGR